MKVTVEEKYSYKYLTYPSLMKSKVGGLVVLMTSECTGFVISSTGQNQAVGYFCERWDMESFVPLKGKVILEND